MRHIVSILITVYACCGMILYAAQSPTAADEEEAAVKDAQAMAFNLYAHYVEAISTESVSDLMNVCQKECYLCGVSKKSLLIPLLAYFRGKINVCYPPESNSYLAQKNEFIRRSFNTYVGLYFITNKDQNLGTVDADKMHAYLQEHSFNVIRSIRHLSQQVKAVPTDLITVQQFNALPTLADKAMCIEQHLDHLQKLCLFTRIILRTDQIRAFDKIFPNMYEKSCYARCFDYCCEVSRIKQGIKLYEICIQLLGLLYPLLDQASLFDRIFYFLNDCKVGFEQLAAQGTVTVEAQTKTLATIFERHFNVAFVVEVPPTVQPTCFC